MAPFKILPRHYFENLDMASRLFDIPKFRKGLNITTAEFPRAIKRLWQLGLFDDVQIRYDDEKNNEI